MFNPDNQENLEKVDRLLEVTDLVMLDIKHIEDEAHKELTKHSNKNILKFAKYLDEKKIPVWIRHVVVPGITFMPEELEGLGKFLAGLSNIEKLEVLPYHAMGKVKYENLGIEYSLADTPQLTKAQGKEAENIIKKAMKA
jgi:pyruvate formate lyase activating enzyme